MNRRRWTRSRVEGDRAADKPTANLEAYDLVTRGTSLLRRALDINPSDAESYKAYGSVLVWSGDEDQAIAWLESALRLDPNAESGVLIDAALAYYLAGRYEDALATAEEAGKRVPAFWSVPVIRAAAHIGDGLRKAGLPESPTRSEP